MLAMHPTAMTSSTAAHKSLVIVGSFAFVCSPFPCVERTAKPRTRAIELNCFAGAAAPKNPEQRPRVPSGTTPPLPALLHLNHPTPSHRATFPQQITFSPPRHNLRTLRNRPQTHPIRPPSPSIFRPSSRQNFANRPSTTNPSHESTSHPPRSCFGASPAAAAPSTRTPPSRTTPPSPRTSGAAYARPDAARAAAACARSSSRPPAAHASPAVLRCSSLRPRAACRLRRSPQRVRLLRWV